MNIFIYSDESGVFDRAHNDLFVYGGLIFLSKENRDICTREYSRAESILRLAENIPDDTEIKASNVSLTGRGKLYRSLNKYYKFGIVIDQRSLLERIFNSKKDKQRYLDYAFKIGLKRKFQYMIRNGLINPDQVENLYFCIDEHSTATNGRYELREGLESEFKWGTFNATYAVHYPPIFENVKSVDLKFCDSCSQRLVRAADIVANRIFYLESTGEQSVHGNKNIYISHLP